MNAIAPGIVVAAVRFHLTASKRETPRVYAPGRANNNVVAEVRINAGTAETRGVNLMRKLNLHTLAELVQFASSRQTIYLHSIPFISMASSSASGRIDFEENLTKANGKTNDDPIGCNQHEFAAENTMGAS